MYSRYNKETTYRFRKIDTQIKAYSIGFICCDSAIRNSMVEISISKSDREILDIIAKEVDSSVSIDNTFDKKTRHFPKARMEKKIPDIKTFLGGEKKTDRHLPIVNKSLDRYLLLGAFDADGCLTWGRRKDKGRIWQKISFTTSFGISVCIQKILMKELDISTMIHPKSGSNCYVIEFSNRKDVLKFLDYIYCNDFVVLRRKYLKSQALRLELEENGEGANMQ